MLTMIVEIVSLPPSEHFFYMCKCGLSLCNYYCHVHSLLNPGVEKGFYYAWACSLKSGHDVRLLHCIVLLMSSSLEAIISHCDLARHTKEDNIETK